MTPLPNTFQCPNLYIDRVMELLTDSELRVLLFATRHILGWQDRIEKRTHAISLTMFEQGFTTQNGVHFGGCGLGRGAIIRAIRELVKYGFLEREGSATEDGQAYRLLTEQIQWVALEARQSESKTKAQKQTAKATSARKDASTSNGTGTSNDTMQGTSNDTMQGTSNVLNQTHSSNPLSNPPISAPSSAEASTAPEKEAQPHPRNLLFDAVAEHIFGTDPKEVNGDGGRIGPIAAWLAGKSDGIQHGKKRENVGFISRPAEPEHVRQFAAAWKAGHQGADIPLDFVKFVEAWRRWASQKKRAAKPQAPPTEPTLSPEELANRRAAMLAEMKLTRPIWEKPS